MTLNEFRAWLEGFEVSFSGPPSEAQWAAVKARLATVTALDISKAQPFAPGPAWTTLPGRPGQMLAPQPIDPNRIFCGDSADVLSRPSHRAAVFIQP